MLKRGDKVKLASGLGNVIPIGTRGKIDLVKTNKWFPYFVVFDNLECGYFSEEELEKC